MYQHHSTSVSLSRKSTAAEDGWAVYTIIVLSMHYLNVSNTFRSLLLRFIKTKWSTNLPTRRLNLSFNMHPHVRSFWYSLESCTLAGSGTCI